MSAPVLAVPDAGERDALAVFCGRVVRLDPAVAVRLRAGEGRVEVWASTSFEVLVTHAVAGTSTPADVTVAGSDLLAALSVVGGPSVDAGTRCDDRWRAPLPPGSSWRVLDEIAGAEADALAEEGIAAGELDRPALTLPGGSTDVVVPMRCLVALAGLGLLVTGDDAGPLRVSVGGSPGDDWVRVELAGGEIVLPPRPSLVLRPV